MSEGLRGVKAGKTALCTVGSQGDDLCYKGYSVEDLSENATFEEVAYIFLYDKIPNQKELNLYCDKLKSLRSIPNSLKQVLKLIPKEAHPMDVMRTGCSFLGNLETEKDFSEQTEQANRMLSVFPAIINFWYQYSHNGFEIDENNSETTISGHFLHTLFNSAPDELQKKVLDVSLILYAEHEFNASTFNARVCAGTLSDIHSAITGAIGTLRGNLHGGANEAAMAMLGNFHSVKEAKNKVLDMLKNKVKIMGFGHAVYKVQDPRSPIIKEWSKKLAEKTGNQLLFDISCEIEKIMKHEKNLFPNADFFHASAYHYLGIPTKLFTPIFVCSRLIGWVAHIFEQRANNKLIRPSAEYTGPSKRKWIKIKDR